MSSRKVRFSLARGLALTLGWLSACAGPVEPAPAGVELGETQAALGVGPLAIIAALAGRHATPAAGQNPTTSIGFYGTDLGYTIRHDGNLLVLFGDSWRNKEGMPVARAGFVGDDVQGVICLRTGGACPSSGIPTFSNGAAVEAYKTSNSNWKLRRAPPVMFSASEGQVLPISLLRHGTLSPLLNTKVGRTPVAGFSNYPNAVASTTTWRKAPFALFIRDQPTSCSAGSCPGQLTCDPGLGTKIFAFQDEPDPNAAVRTPCVRTRQDGSIDTACDLTGGICRATYSALATTGLSGLVYRDEGRLLSIAQEMEVGFLLNADAPLSNAVWITKKWQTSLFVNPATASVEKFRPDEAVTGTSFLPSVADGLAPLADEKVFIWGRPWFLGRGADPSAPPQSGSTDRSDKLYLAYVTMPRPDASSLDFAWAPRYFTGMNGAIPTWSSNEWEAKPLSLDGTPGGSPSEQFDTVGQMSIRWIAALNKWVMLYGGGTLREFAFPLSVLMPGGMPQQGFHMKNNQLIYQPDGAILVRTAPYPWGPWSPPQVLAKGFRDPQPTQNHTPIIGSSPCEHGVQCAARETDAPDFALMTPHGVLYGPNIVDEWTTPASGGAVDIYWNVSTWDPYEVVLMRSRLTP